MRKGAVTKDAEKKMKDAQDEEGEGEGVQKEEKRTKRQKMIDKRRRKEYRRRKRELSGRGECYQRTAKVVTFIWTQTFARIGEDWVFLALLGMIMALVSFMMDYCIVACGQARLRLVEDLVTNVPGQFVAWVTLPVLLVLVRARSGPPGHRIRHSRDENHPQGGRAQRISYVQDFVSKSGGSDLHAGLGDASGKGGAVCAHCVYSRDLVNKISDILPRNL